MTTTTSRTGRSTPIAAPASRAVLAAALAAVVTFSLDGAFRSGADYTARFGLLVLGVYLVLQGVLLAAWAGRLARTRPGLLLLLGRSAASLVGGAVALAQPAGGLDLLRPVEALVLIVVGALEVVGGVQRAEGPDVAGDGVVVGGLQVVVGLMVVILDADTRFSLGVLGAWGALIAVYLGISAANLRVKRRRA